MDSEELSFSPLGTGSRLFMWTGLLADNVMIYADFYFLYCYFYISFCFLNSPFYEEEVISLECQKITRLYKVCWEVQELSGPLNPSQSIGPQRPVGVCAFFLCNNSFNTLLHLNLHEIWIFPRNWKLQFLLPLISFGNWTLCHYPRCLASLIMVWKDLLGTTRNNLLTWACLRNLQTTLRGLLCVATKLSLLFHVHINNTKSLLNVDSDFHGCLILVALAFGIMLVDQIKFG